MEYLCKLLYNVIVYRNIYLKTHLFDKVEIISQ